ncbi:MAG: type II toxin-antitoxin system RelE/ParE family toxin [Deltaproteobacteria bacterium]|nr:type II toxin-antitoxin system RelE/ParE family toxin [Deltaproteobacteria bacterium]
MEISVQEIREYIRGDGKNYFRKWLRSLQDKQARAKIRVRLNRIRLGIFGDAKAVGNGVNEIRIHHGPGYRIYFGRVSNTIVLLLCGGDKERTINNLNKLMSFLPSSSLLVDHITRYARSSRLEYNKKSY